MAGIDLSFGSSDFPRALEVRKFLYANALMGISGRYRRLDRFDAFYKGLEYCHQGTSWEGGDADSLETISSSALDLKGQGFVKPAQEAMVRTKRPTAPTRMCPMVVDRFTGMLFSKKRTPEIAVEGDPDSEAFLKAVFKKAKFWRQMHQARTYGGSMGSTLVTLHLRDARFSYRAHSPKVVHDIQWADPDLKIPAGVLIQYTYVEEMEELSDKDGRPTGKMREKYYLYRRIIDEQMDIIFKPAEIVEGKRLPVLEIDEMASYQHGLGRFPGVWIQNLPDSEEIDGIPDCDGAYQMFDTIDRQVAQQNKALLNNQDPTLVVSRDKKYALSKTPIKKGSDNAIDVGQGGSANYLEISAAGVSASREYVRDMRQRALDKCQMVTPDPERMAGAAQSAMAIELLFEPTIEKADRLRDQYGQAIEDLAFLTLDLGRRWSDSSQYMNRFQDGKMVANPVPAYDLPPRIEEHDADPGNPDVEPVRITKPQQPGPGGVVSLSWGPYWEPTPTDVQTQVTVIATAYGADLIDHETAVRKLAPLLDIEDADAMLRKVQEQKKEKKREAAEMASLYTPDMGVEPGLEEPAPSPPDPGPGALPPF